MDAQVRAMFADALVALGLGLTLLAGGARAVAAQEPGMSAVGSALATGTDLLETEIIAESFEPPAHPGDSPRFVLARRLAAGDEVHYTIRVRNPGREPVRDVQVTKRMPFGMHYIQGSAAGPASNIEFSADAGRSFRARPDAPDYSHLRWSLRRPLPPGATALLRFRATFR
jgi:uncharacterized repeat protein (TIGR01451 family)